MIYVLYVLLAPRCTENTNTTYACRVLKGYCKMARMGCHDDDAITPKMIAGCA